MKLSYILLALALLTGCRNSQPASLRVLCGSSMAAPMQEAGKLFTERRGIPMEFDFGGSETLLPKVIAGVSADVFVCHDPFEDKLKAANRWAGTAVTGYLQPVLAVRPGNPKAIRSLEDLKRSDLKLGIGDPRYSTCGQLFVETLDKRGMRGAVMPQVVLQARTHAEVANGLILGPLDAVVVWNFIAVLYPGKLELVPTDATYPETRVTVVGLTQSQNPALRDAFLEYCRSSEVQHLFRRHGYGR